jgi:hypothetical protein
MLEGHGIVKNMTFWSRFLFVVAMMHFLFASVILYVSLIAESGLLVEQVMFAACVAIIGHTWHRVGKECALRIKK